MEVLAANSLLDSAPVLDESHDLPLGVAMGAFSIKQSSFKDLVTITPMLPVSLAAPALETKGDQYDLENVFDSYSLSITSVTVWSTKLLDVTSA